MDRVKLCVVALAVAALMGCESTPEKTEKTWHEVRAERVAEFVLHLNNRSETERHRDGLAEVGLKSPEDRDYVIAQCDKAYDKSIQRGGTGTGVLRTPGRRRVMEVLGRLPSTPRSKALLKRGLKDTPEVQIPAAAALGKFGEASALPVLVSASIAVLDDDARRVGIQHLRRLATPARREAFLNALSGKGRVLLRPILLKTFPADKKTQGEALRVVAGEHGNPYARAFALEVLADHKDPSVVALARKALDSGDVVVRPTALQVLGSAGGNKAAGELEKVLRGNPQDADAVVKGLYGVGSAEALQRAMALIRDEALTAGTRAAVVRGFLGRIRESKAPGAYRSAEAREAVLEGLRERLEEEETEVVIASAMAIGRIGDSGADVEPLLGLLSDPAPDVGKAVVIALGRLGGQDAGAKLVQLLGSDDELRDTAADAFKTFPRAKDVPVGAVIDMLKDERLEVRRAAITALKHIRRNKDPMGFEAEGRESARALAIKTWRNWWKTRRGG
jgi:HEAT repeat protein